MEGAAAAHDASLGRRLALTVWDELQFLWRGGAELDEEQLRASAELVVACTSPSAEGGLIVEVICAPPYVRQGEKRMRRLASMAIAFALATGSAYGAEAPCKCQCLAKDGSVFGQPPGPKTAKICSQVCALVIIDGQGLKGVCQTGVTHGVQAHPIPTARLTYEQSFAVRGDR